MKLIDANHIEAHLKCIKQIVIDNFDDFDEGHRDGLINAFSDVKNIVDSVTEGASVA